MRKGTRHPASRMVLGHAIGRDREREALIADKPVIVVAANFLVRGRIGLVLRIERVARRRLQWLVMRGQRTIFQSARYPNPTHAVGMQAEWFIAAESGISLRVLCWFIVGCFGCGEVGDIFAGPLFLLRV